MAAGDFSTPAIGTKVEVSTSINGVAGFHEIPGLSNIDFTSPNIQKTTFEMLNGRSVQRTGASQASTLTAQLAANQSSPLFDILLNAKNNGTALTFRYSTAPAEGLFNSNEGTRDGQVAIAQTTGVCTFSGTAANDAYPNFGGDEAGAYAVGHALLLDGDATIYRIAEITTAANAWKGNVIVSPGPAADVAAADFNIIRPQAVATFQATVTQIGNISAAPSAAVTTDSLELSATRVLTPNDFVLNATGITA